MLLDAKTWELGYIIWRRWILCMTILGCLSMSSCALYAQGQQQGVLSSANRQLSLSANWPDSVAQSFASGLESAPIGRSVLYLKVGKSEMPEEVRARVKVYAENLSENASDAQGDKRVLLGTFSLFPASGTEGSQTVAMPVFAFNLEPFLNSLSAEEKQETIVNDLYLTLELVPFESEADLAQGQIEIIAAEIKWLADL